MYKPYTPSLDATNVFILRVLREYYNKANPPGSQLVRARLMRKEYFVNHETMNINGNQLNRRLGSLARLGYVKKQYSSITITVEQAIAIGYVEADDLPAGCTHVDFPDEEPAYWGISKKGLEYLAPLAAISLKSS